METKTTTHKKDQTNNLPVKSVIEEKNYPKMTGVVSDGLQNKIGKISLWMVDSVNEKSPILEGKIEVDGIKYKVALWNYVPKNVNP